MILLCGTCCWTVGKQTSAVVLSQLQNFYYAAEKFLQFYYLSGRVFVHLRNINILLFCYSASPVAEIFFLWEIFCCSATPVAEFFSSEKFSAILLLHYPSGRIFLIWETFCYSTILLSHSSRIFPPECFSYCSETNVIKVIMIICLVGGGRDWTNNWFIGI